MKHRNPFPAAAAAAWQSAGRILALQPFTLARAAATAAQARDEGTASQRLEVSPLRNAKGTLNRQRFGDAAGLPAGEGAPTLRAAIIGTQASCVFDGIPPGTDGVALAHDENGNGQLDKNVLGIPPEGYGVSNNRAGTASSPQWDELRFSVAAPEPAALRINLRY